jgi:RimJ/RimL family protein N-acetyltransferase
MHNIDMPSLTRPVLEPGSWAVQAQPVLAGGELVLRPWQRDDRSPVVAAYSDSDIQQWHARSMTTDEADAWIRSWPGRWSSETGCGWAITAAGVVVGQISLRRLVLADGLAEVSYWVLPSARGARVATRALTVLSDWAFGAGLHRVEVEHSTVNVASCRVASAVGYLLEGTKRSEALHPDGWHDMHLHARVARDGLAESTSMDSP